MPPLIYRYVRPVDARWTVGNYNLAHRGGTPIYQRQMKITSVEWSGDIDPSCFQFPERSEGYGPWQWGYPPADAISTALINDMIGRRTEHSGDNTPPYAPFYYSTVPIASDYDNPSLLYMRKMQQWYDNQGLWIHGIRFEFDVRLVWDYDLNYWEWAVFDFALYANTYCTAEPEDPSHTARDFERIYVTLLDSKAFSAGTADTQLRIGQELRMAYCGQHPELAGTAIILRAGYAT